MANTGARRPILSISNMTLLLAFAPLPLTFASIYLFAAAQRWLGPDLPVGLLLLGYAAYLVVWWLARCPVCRGFPMSGDGSLLGVRRLSLRPTTCGRCGADYRRLTFWTRIPRDDLLAHMAFRKNKGLGSHDFSE